VPIVERDLQLEVTSARSRRTVRTALDEEVVAAAAVAAGARRACRHFHQCLERQRARRWRPCAPCSNDTSPPREVLPDREFSASTAALNAYLQ
jgi:hypothetical protein